VHPRELEQAISHTRAKKPAADGELGNEESERLEAKPSAPSASGSRQGLADLAKDCPITDGRRQG